MKKLDVVLTTKVGEKTTTRKLNNIGVRELNDAWRATYLFLGHMNDVSDVASVLEPITRPDLGRADVSLNVVVTKGGGGKFQNVTSNYYGMDAQQVAYFLAALENAFIKAGIKWERG